MNFSKYHTLKKYKYSTYKHPHLRRRRQGAQPPFFYTFTKLGGGGGGFSPRFRLLWLELVATVALQTIPLAKHIISSGHYCLFLQLQVLWLFSVVKYANISSSNMYVDQLYVVRQHRWGSYFIFPYILLSSPYIPLSCFFYPIFCLTFLMFPLCSLLSSVIFLLFSSDFSSILHNFVMYIINEQQHDYSCNFERKKQKHVGFSKEFKQHSSFELLLF